MNRILNLFYLLLENANYVAIMALTFLAVALLVGGIVLLAIRRNPTAERLEKLVPRKPKSTAAKPKLLESEENSLVAKISTPLHRIIAPGEGATRKKIRLRLIQAGFRSERAFRNFLAAKVLLAVLLPVLYIFSFLFYRVTPLMALTCIALAFLGFYLPNLFIWILTKSRQDEMRKALPDALDLMVVCVEAGLGLDMTFRKVGDEIRPISPHLSDEFYITNLEVRAGKVREDSLKDMALRSGLAEVHNLVTILIQTSRFGTSVAKALRVHADAMRKKRHQIAEEKAAKASVKLVFPLIVFILPALLIVLAGPAAIRIVKTLFPVFGG
jgi:tight adherence protein C